VERQQIREALDTSASMLYRVRRATGGRRVRGGFEPQTAVPPSNTRRFGKIWQRSISRAPKPSCWSRTISISTARRTVAEAKRLVERFERHYTPNALWWRYPFWHDRWLDLNESQLGVLPAQCLDHRIPDKRPSSTKPPPGSASEISIILSQTGTSPPKTLAPSFDRKKH
jgi:hypothetical protein